MFRIDKSSVSANTQGQPFVVSYKLSQEPLPMPEAEFEDIEPMEVDPEASAEALTEAAQTPEELMAMAKEEALKILNQAEKEAQLIIQRANVTAANIHTDAYNQGLKKGFDEGSQKISQERQQESEALEALFLNLAGTKEKIIDSLEEEMWQLSLAVAEKIVHMELDQNDQAFKNMMQSALIQMKGEGNVIIRVNARDYQRLFDSNNSFKFNLPTGTIQVTVIDEDFLSPGACLIESDGETINASVDTQLKAIAQAFKRQEGDNS